MKSSKHAVLSAAGIILVLAGVPSARAAEPSAAPGEMSPSQSLTRKEIEKLHAQLAAQERKACGDVGLARGLNDLGEVTGTFAKESIVGGGALYAIAAGVTWVVGKVVVDTAALMVPDLGQPRTANHDDTFDRLPAEILDKGYSDTIKLSAAQEREKEAAQRACGQAQARLSESQEALARLARGEETLSAPSIATQDVKVLAEVSVAAHAADAGADAVPSGSAQQ